MTNQELADWFGIKEKSLRSCKEKKFEELKEYAEFEVLRGKIRITKIFKTVRTKENKSFKFIKSKTLEQWSDTGLDTCKNVSNKIISNYKQDLSLADSTVYTYTCESKRELWGKAYDSKGGEIGFCVYELCKQIDNQCIEFTEEEQKIKSKLLNKYFGKADEKVLYIQDMIENGEITEEESWQELRDIMNLDNNYMAFKANLESQIGCRVVRATKTTTVAF